MYFLIKNILKWYIYIYIYILFFNIIKCIKKIKKINPKYKKLLKKPVTKWNVRERAWGGQEPRRLGKLEGSWVPTVFTRNVVMVTVIDSNVPPPCHCLLIVLLVLTSLRTIIRPLLIFFQHIILIYAIYKRGP